MSPPQSSPLLVKNHIIESHKVIQEVQLNNDCTTDEQATYFLASQKFEEDPQGCSYSHLGNDDKNNETAVAIASQILKKYSNDRQLLQHQNLVVLSKGEARRVPQ